MKKLLIASTALSLAGGAAFAEISISGDAELGVDYNSEAGEGMSKHSFVHEVGIDFSASGTTDGGLTFGGSAGFDTNDDMVNLGTVHVSGSFGTLTIGDNDPGSFIAGGIADIGMNGIGVDDMAENLRKGTASQLRYDNSFGQVSIAISAGTKDGSAAVKGSGPTSWSIIDHTDELRVYNSDPTEFGDQFDALFNIFRTIEDGDVTGIANRNDADTGAGTNAIFSSAATVGYADHDDDSDTPDVLVADVNADDTFVVVNLESEAGKAVAATYERYVAVYDLGKDEKVGGGDDKRKPVANNAVPDVPGVGAETEFAFGMNFETGGVTIGLGYDSNKTVSMGAGFSAGEISTNLLYVKMDDDEDTKDMNEEATSMGVDLSYSMGASTVTLAYGRHKPEEKGMEAMDAVGMGVTHDLGGGATMNAGFGKVDTMVDKKIVSQNKASIGLMFAF